jgi:hypothetical protein
MKWIFLIAFSFSFYVNAEEDEEVTIEDCKREIESARENVNREAERLQRQVSDFPLTPAANQGFSSTGNSLVDLINNSNQANQQIAKVEQDTSAQVANIEDSCFNQNQTMDAKADEFRRSTFKRKQLIDAAYTEKMNQEADVRMKCGNEATENFTQELARLRNPAGGAGYRARSVSTISGVTQSEREIRLLEDRFYARCMARRATRETLQSIKDNYDLKLRNLKTESEAFLADMDSLERNRMRLGEHCSLRLQRVFEQNRIQQNSLRQAAQLNSMALNVSLMTSNAGMMNQNQTSGRFTSVEQILDPANWQALSEACTAQARKPFEVPLDILPNFTEVSRKCARANGSNASCVVSSGQNSAEKQRIINGNRQINQ